RHPHRVRVSEQRQVVAGVLQPGRVRSPVHGDHRGLDQRRSRGADQVRVLLQGEQRRIVLRRRTEALNRHCSSAISGRIPRRTYIGRAAARSAGSARKNRTDPTTQAAPPTAIVVAGPNLSAMTPANRLPNGTVPKNAMVKKLITRPRLSSSTSVCRMVLLAAICTIIPSPVGTRIAKDSQKLCDCEKAMSPMPNPPLASTMTRPRPSTLFRDAR